MRRPIGNLTIGVRFVAGHLLIALGLATAFVCTQGHGSGKEYDIYRAATFGVAISQAGLLGLWAGLSKAPTSNRAAGALAGGLAVYVGLAITLDTASGGPNFKYWAISAILAPAPLVATGILGVVLRSKLFVVERIEASKSERDRQKVQFSLLHLFVLTLVAAMLFALVRELRERSGGVLPGAWRYAPIVAFNALLFVLHTQICVWSSLGTRRPPARLGAILFSTAISAGIYGFAGGGRMKDYLFCAVMLAVYSIFTAGSLLMLRQCGYRLMRRTELDAVHIRE